MGLVVIHSRAKKSVHGGSRAALPWTEAFSDLDVTAYLVCPSCPASFAGAPVDGVEQLQLPADRSAPVVDPRSDERLALVGRASAHRAAAVLVWRGWAARAWVALVWAAQVAAADPAWVAPA